MNKVTLLKGDCIKKLKGLKANSVDSIVTDPPYGIGFMNKEWDSPKKHRELIEREQKRSEKRHKEGKSPAKGTFSKGVQPGLAIGGAKEGKWFEQWTELWAKEAYRVLKPGGYVLSFCAPRMYHRMTSGIEDAGFQIRDQIMWVFGSGFPKSHNIGKKVEQYEGWGTALKPAHEPIVMARKPLSEKTIAKNVLEHGTGGINIDGCRVSTDDKLTRPNVNGFNKEALYSNFNNNGSEENGNYDDRGSVEGRFPANIIFDEEAGKILDEQSGITYSGPTNQKVKYGGGIFGGGNGKVYEANSGGASRFFYCPKASKKDRNDGCDELDEKLTGHKANHRCKNCGKQKSSGSPCVCKEPDYEEIPQKPQSNFHPTVKPTELMAYLIRLVTPKGGVVLDPFMGSGSTGKAAVREGVDFIGIEREKEYMKIAKTRIEHEQSKNKHRQFFDEEV